jgi:hypothetical protein
MTSSSDKSQKIILAGAGVACLLSFVIGRLSAPQAPEPQAPPTPVSAAASTNPGASTTLRYDLPARPMSPWARDRIQPGWRPGIAAPEGAAAGSAESDEPVPELLKLSALLKKEAGPDAEVEHDRDEELALATQALEERVKADPRALNQVLREFMKLESKAELEALAAILGRVRDADVETMAIETASSDASTQRRLAALQVLDGLDLPSARPVAIAVLERESDPELRRAAVFAIPEPTGSSRRDAEGVVSNMTRIISQDQDAELRRRAVIQMGSWWRDRSDLSSVVQALQRDASPDVRAAAAFSLEMAGHRDAEIIDALCQRMSDSREDSIVREMAWRALGRMGPLAENAATQYASFAALLARSNEGR